MEYSVRLTDRAFRDMEALCEFIEAYTSESASRWFKNVTKAVYSLEQFPERGGLTPESRKFRQLLFGKKPETYRIIYAIDKRNRAVNVLHIRHGARAPLQSKQM